MTNQNAGNDSAAAGELSEIGKLHLEKNKAANAFADFFADSEEWENGEDSYCVFHVAFDTFMGLEHTLFMLQKMHELRKNDGLKDPKKFDEFMSCFNCVGGNMSQYMARLEYIALAPVEGLTISTGNVEADMAALLHLGKNDEFYTV